VIILNVLHLTAHLVYYSCYEKSCTEAVLVMFLNNVEKGFN